MSIFDWECFYHIEDFTYCLSITWVTLLIIYLVAIVSFVVVAAIIVMLKRRQRNKYKQHADEIYAQYQTMR